MTKEEVFDMVEAQPWQDGNGNKVKQNGSIKSIWGYTKDECVTVHKVHYDNDPFFHQPMDTGYCLTKLLPVMSFDANKDNFDWEKYNWVGSTELFDKGLSIHDVMKGA